MIRLRNLLLPVDYSTRSLDAADSVRLIGSRTPVKVTVLHVPDGRALQRADKELIDAFRDRLTGFNVAYREVAGDPAEVIVEYSETHPTDLIVMPTRGRGGLRRLLGGSVTSKVLARVACPVWTGVTTEQSFAKPVRLRTVACGVDLGPKSADVLRWASDLAHSHEAQLVVVHASSQIMPVTGIIHDREWRKHVAEILRTDLAELLTKTGVSAEIMLATGEPATAVTAAAERLGADVLVIGRTGKGFSRWIQSEAYEMIRQANCPVVSIDAVADRPEPAAHPADAVSQPEKRHADEFVEPIAGL